MAEDAAPPVAGNEGKAATPPVQSPHADTSPASGERVADNWQFSTSDEDWGKTCFVQATGNYGKVKVGFMGSPGKDIVPFVDGIFDGDTHATWQVDDKPSHASDGGQNDYFGWYEFGDLPRSVVNEVGAGGDQLSITTDTGKRIDIGLIGSVSAIAAFRKCYARQ